MIRVLWSTNGAVRPGRLLAPVAASSLGDVTLHRALAPSITSWEVTGVHSMRAITTVNDGDDSDEPAEPDWESGDEVEVDTDVLETAPAPEAVPVPKPSFTAASLDADPELVPFRDATKFAEFSLPETRRLGDNMVETGTLFGDGEELSPEQEAVLAEKSNDLYAQFQYKNREAYQPDEGWSKPGSSDPGLSLDYCVFCYHGTHFLREDNTALLSKFVTVRGRVLPKRFTKCCAKHQRKLAKTIKRSRHMNLLPYHHKLHPSLRFTSYNPKPTTKISTDPADTDEAYIDAALKELEQIGSDSRRE